MVRMLVLSVFVTFGACSENDFKSMVPEQVLPEADIDVSPTEIQFSELRADAEETRSFTITNEGDAALHVTDVTVEGAAFTILSPETEFFLDPDETRDIAVAFSPIAMEENTGTAWVYSDDVDEPDVPVDLNGLGAVPELVISPDPYDFGRVQIGCLEQQTITLENIGNEILIIEDISYKSAGNLMEVLDLNIMP
ncbi:MAG: choice-of-anchor D domain-containing protein, partial [Proteobacteria bacterium]|nr:choice-of-anchor D domain-containing protein [Pseudomonadota bacterium]